MPDFRRIAMGRKALHIEAPGCIVNIEMLHDAEGCPVTRVDVSADGDRYAGGPEWWCADAGQPLGPRGIGVRVVQGISRPAGPRDIEPREPLPECVHCGEDCGCDCSRGVRR